MTMRPQPPSFMSAETARERKNGPSRFTAIDSRQTLVSCAQISRSWPEPIPALRTRISTGPSRLRASATMRSQPSSVATDSARTSIGASSARDASSSSVRETPSTRAPREASASAVARPMPRPAPVTMATRPSMA